MGSRAVLGSKVELVESERKLEHESSESRGDRVQKKEQACLSVAEHTYGKRMDPILSIKPIDYSKDFLYLEPYDVAPDLKRHTIDPFPVRLVRHLYTGNPGPIIAAIDQHRDDHLTAASATGARLPTGAGEVFMMLAPRPQLCFFAPLLFGAPTRPA